MLLYCDFGIISVCICSWNLLFAGQSCLTCFSYFQVYIMSGDYKLDIGTHHGSEEPRLSTTIDSKLSLDEYANAVHTTFNGIRDQGKLAVNNFSTNAERRALTDRCKTSILF